MGTGMKFYMDQVLPLSFMRYSAGFPLDPGFFCLDRNIHKPSEVR